MERKSSKWNDTALFLGFVNEREKIGLSGGVINRLTHERAKKTDMVPLGSVTKPYTAARVVQLVEQGVLGLDDPMHKWADPVLKKWNGTTALKLFGDPLIHNVTIRHLLSMRSGIQEYNDTRLEDETVQHPKHDIGPFELLAQVNKTLVFAPGTHGQYSSMNYVFIGLVLASVTNASKWTDFDQRSVFSVDLVANYSATHFPVIGPCSQATRVHQYGRTGMKFGNHKILEPGEKVDLFDSSCLNGKFRVQRLWFN
jgi:CubicO group peptidase (beta-lactamase class C family)